MDFYDRVKLLVKSQNMTLEMFILSLNINYDSYNSQKRYNNIPRGDDCVKIAQELGTTVEYLVTGQESNKAASELAELKAQLAELRDKMDKLLK